MPSIERWAEDRCAALVDLLDQALPEEDLTRAELQANLWADPSPAVVLGCDDGTGAVAAVIREQGGGGPPIGHIRLLGVHPSVQRKGVGSALLAAAEAWLNRRDVREVWAGGDAPFYLWPGIDVRWTAALAFFETAGYHESGAVFDMACASTFSAPTPSGVSLRPTRPGDDVRRVLGLVEREWPWWRSEVERAVQGRSCIVAVDEAGDLLGFGCHSVNRRGWIGPVGSDPARGRSGVGSAILGALCGKIADAGLDQAEIAWVGPVAFYAKVADAHMSRVFQRRFRRLG